MNSNNIVPKIDIVENGEVVSPERMNPSIIQFVFQAAQLAQMTKLRKLEESKIPIGTKSIKLTVTDTETTITLPRPWISFSLINDGAGTVYIKENDKDKTLTDGGGILSGETVTIDFEYPIIKRFHIVAALGTTANVRISGEEGQWR